MVEIDVLYEVWRIAKEYIPARDRGSAADHVFNQLLDLGIRDSDLRDFCQRDRQLFEIFKSHGLDSDFHDSDDEIED